MKRIMIEFALVFGFIILILVGCSNQVGSKNNAVGAIETYVKALTAKDTNQLTNASCAAWESNAQIELDSLTAVSATLQDLKCQEAGKDGQDTLVTCQGKIVLDYNGENQELNLEGRTYRARNDGGEWRMCGYK
jgi:hypothetical protein